MYWERPKPLWMWPHWAKVIWSCIKYGNAKHKIYYNDNYFWSIFSHIFFRGRLHLKINCANNKLTCEGKWRLIKMSRSQLFLIVSCFVSNSQLHFSIWPDSVFDSINPDLIPIFLQSISLPCRASLSKIKERPFLQ